MSFSGLYLSYNGNDGNSNGGFGPFYKENNIVKLPDNVNSSTVVFINCSYLNNNIRHNSGYVLNDDYIKPTVYGRELWALYLAKMII